MNNATKQPKDTRDELQKAVDAMGDFYTDINKRHDEVCKREAVAALCVFLTNTPPPEYWGKSSNLWHYDTARGWSYTTEAARHAVKRQFPTFEDALLFMVEFSQKRENILAARDYFWGDVPPELRYTEEEVREFVKSASGKTYTAERGEYAGQTITVKGIDYLGGENGSRTRLLVQAESGAQWGCLAAGVMAAVVKESNLHKGA